MLISIVPLHEPIFIHYAYHRSTCNVSDQQPSVVRGIYSVRSHAAHSESCVTCYLEQSRAVTVSKLKLALGTVLL